MSTCPFESAAWRRCRAIRRLASQAVPPGVMLAWVLVMPALLLQPAAAAGIITFYHLFDNLVVRDLTTMQIVPHLATSWKTLDELTWEFTLRHDVTFHNGDKFTAHTVKFNYDRCLNPEQKCPQRGNHAKIKEVQTRLAKLRTGAGIRKLLAHTTPTSMEIADAVHKAGAYFYGDGANYNALVGRVRPADLGMDVMHINLHLERIGDQAVNVAKVALMTAELFMVLATKLGARGSSDIRALRRVARRAG